MGCGGYCVQGSGGLGAAVNKIRFCVWTFIAIAGPLVRIRLDAHLVDAALDHIDLAGLDLLFVENVGNLVCPAAFDLGEQLRLVLLAAGEGEDKPLKYPALFQSADVVVISKLDLAAAVGFRRRQAHRAIRRVAPRARIVEASARSGEGLAELMALLRCLPPRATSRDELALDSW